MNIYELKEQFQIVSNNPWAGTPLESYYLAPAKSKGSKGEEIVSHILTYLGYQVKPRQNTGHDRIVNGVKTEIKFATAINRNAEWGCMFNHIGFEKDWDEILLVCVNGDGNIRGVVYNKNNFPKDLANHQQGGVKSDNDDYLINSNNSYNVLFNEVCTIII